MLNLRYEDEMMRELALVAVREGNFYTDGSIYSLPNGRGQTFKYEVDYLDVRFVETGKRDCVVRLRSVIAPFAPPLFCMLSEMQDDE